MIPRPLVFALLAFSAVLAIGTGGYMMLEGWRPLDALWMVVITLTTIGYGEVHRLSDAGRVFTIGLVLSGLGIGTYTMGSITRLMVEGKLGQAMRQRWRRQRMEQLRDHYVVVGYGRLGQAIVDELRAAGVPYCVVERDPHLVGMLEERGIASVVGDGSDDQVLRTAGIERAAGLAVAVSSAAEAVFTTLSARELNPRLNIVTRVADAETAIKAKRAGASSVVSPHTMGGWRMAHGLVRPHTTSFLDLATLASHEDILLEEYLLPDDSPLVGKTLADLRVGERWRVLLVAIRRKDGRMIPTPQASDLLQAGDIVIAIGGPDPVRRFGAFLTGRSPAP